MHHVFRFLLRLKAKNFKKLCTKKSRSCIYDWRWCKSVRVNEEMYLRVCVCVHRRSDELNCLSPTYCFIRARCHSDRQLHLLSLSPAQRDADNLPSPPATCEKKKKRWHANNSPGWLGGGTNETSQGIRRRKWESGFEVWTFSFCNVSSWRAHPFSPPSPSTPEKDVHQIRALEPRVKYSKDSIASVSSTTCELCFCSATIPQTTRNGL